MPQALRVKTLITTTMALTVAGVVATAVPAYATPGNLDSAFGTGGTVTTDFGANPSEPEIANDMAIQPDGKIIAAGRAGVDQTPIGGDGAFGIVRYLPNGSLDPTFGTGGLVKTKFQAPPNRDVARAVALQSDGKILVGGTSGVFDTPAKLAMARYNADGSLDSSFGTGGIVLMNVSNGLGDAIRGLAVQPDGKILGVGAAGGENLLIRFNTDGTLDSSFGNGGTSQPVLGSSGHLFAMKLLSNGTFLAAGTGTTGANQGDFLVARFTSTGALDSTFGTGGLTITAITAQNDLLFDMAGARHGQIIPAGGAHSRGAPGVPAGAPLP